MATESFLIKGDPDDTELYLGLLKKGAAIASRGGVIEAINGPFFKAEGSEGELWLISVTVSRNKLREWNDVESQPAKEALS